MSTRGFGYAIWRYIFRSMAQILASRKTFPTLPHNWILIFCSHASTRVSKPPISLSLYVAIHYNIHSPCCHLWLQSQIEVPYVPIKQNRSRRWSKKAGQNFSKCEDDLPGSKGGAGLRNESRLGFLFMWLSLCLLPLTLRRICPAGVASPCAFGYEITHTFHMLPI